jgi:hypothetical protein
LNGEIGIGDINLSVFGINSVVLAGSLEKAWLGGKRLIAYILSIFLAKGLAASFLVHYSLLLILMPIY